MENANSNCNNADSSHSENNSPTAALKVCFGCKKVIEDDFRLRVSPNLEWHASCLSCAECQQILDESCTCFIKEGLPYCRKDYMRLFGIKCSACHETIADTDFVMRAKSQVFHMKCFCCSTCEKHLTPGEQFGVSNGKLFCKCDFDMVKQQDMRLSSPSEMENCNNHIVPPSTNNNNTGSTNGLTPNNPTHSTTSSSSTSSGGSSGGSNSTKRSNSEKGPRVRTVLSEQQLQTLRTVYASNPRPDALLKEHLVEITGLSPRVIRVWFQNKRCKDKKKQIQAESLRQQQHQVMQQGGANPVIPPLTPQTPLTPDSMGQISPHPGISAFTYPPAPASYDNIQSMVSTPTHTAVSPIVTYHQNPVWGSPTDTMTHYEAGTGYSSPISSEQQSYICSTPAPVTAATGHGYY